ncbi:MAG: molybdenum cofactor guanylyltransferase [Hyphomicrobiales bacterium]
MGEFENIAGLVLAQGGSVRMGRDKAALDFNGRSFLQITVEHLAAVGAGAAYISHQNHMADLKPDLGPLGGIYTAFKTHIHVEYWLILPVDMPLLSPDILEHLLAGLGDCDIARYEDEMFPLLLKTSAAMRAHLYKLAQDEERTYSMRQFMKPFNVNTLRKPEGSEAGFANINTPEDYEAICG